MKRSLLMLIALSFSGAALAEGTVSVPWTEFSKLYRERVERELMETHAIAPDKQPQVHTVESAVYRLTVGSESAKGDVLVSGRIISGDPEPIPLFGRDIVITKTEQISGGSLVAGPEGAGQIAFLPDDSTNEFQVMLSFLVEPGEDSRSRTVAFDIPSAIKNSLSVKLSDETMLLECPGIRDATGIYRFSAATSLNVRFKDKKSVSTTALAEIDTISQIRLQGQRAIVTTTFAPIQRLPGAFTLRMSADAQFVSSSLKASWIQKEQDGAYEIRIPPNEQSGFTMQFAVAESKVPGSFDLALPSVKDNNGREGDFVVDEPDGGQISLVGEELVSRIPVTKLSRTFVGVFQKKRFYSHIAPNKGFKLNIRRFKSVPSSPIVLDSLRFFTSFEENGGVLSVLAMDIPPEMGPRMKLKSVPGAEIWSLTVNGRKRKVYMDNGGAWVIPLEAGATSRVQLALLGKGPKLGLHGSLEAVLPETGLPARTVQVGIALPERVQLLSLEGPVNPAAGDSWESPVEFVGQPYFFSRSFYKGQEMKLAVFYKQPAKQEE